MWSLWEFIIFSYSNEANFHRKMPLDFRDVWHVIYILFPLRNKSPLWQCKTELRTSWLRRGIFGYTWWYVDKIKFETEEVGGVKKVSSLVHKEQHPRWPGPGARGLSEDLDTSACWGEVWSCWSVLRAAVELIFGFRLRQAPGEGTDVGGTSRERGRVDGWGVEGSCLPAAGISSGNW